MSEWGVTLSVKVNTEKVLCYVVRDGRLLVFRHVDESYEEIGIQVPAGSVSPGETPEAAALREAREETGLSGFGIVRKLGTTEYDMTPYRFEVQRRHFFQLELTGAAPERWSSQEDHDGEGEPTRFECFWIPLETAHVLQSGQGALLGRLLDADAPASDAAVADAPAADTPAADTAAKGEAGAQGASGGLAGGG